MKSNEGKIIVTLVTQGLPSSFLSRPVALRNIKSENVGLYVESISTLFVVCLRHLSIQRVCLHTSLSGLFRLA